MEILEAIFYRYYDEPIGLADMLTHVILFQFTSDASNSGTKINGRSCSNFRSNVSLTRNKLIVSYILFCVDHFIN